MDSEEILTMLYIYYAAAVAALVIVCILIGRALIRRDGTKKYQMPAINDLDWASIAFLRGGQEALLETVDFRLAQQGAIAVPYYTPNDSGNPAPARGRLEQLRWNYYKEAWEYSDKKEPKPTPTSTCP